MITVMMFPSPKGQLRFVAARSRLHLKFEDLIARTLQLLKKSRED
jgi:hypothetical protein